MTNTQKSIFKAVLPVDFITRKCLLCSSLCHPHGIGDRVCSACKETAEWKKGSFVGPYFSGLD